MTIDLRGLHRDNFIYTTKKGERIVVYENGTQYPLFTLIESALSGTWRPPTRRRLVRVLTHLSDRSDADVASQNKKTRLAVSVQDSLFSNQSKLEALRQRLFVPATPPPREIIHVSRESFFLPSVPLWRRIYVRILRLQRAHRSREHRSSAR